MFYKLFILGGLVVSFTACAKPNYQNLDSSRALTTQKTKSCNLIFKDQGLCADIVWQAQPTESDMGSFTLSFYTLSSPQNLMDPAKTVAVVLWMPSMGHGSSPVQIDKKENGIYNVSNVFFVMPGEWEIRIQLKDGKNVIAQVIKKITI